MNKPCFEPVQEIAFSSLVLEQGLVKEAEELRNEIHSELRSSFRIVESDIKLFYRNAHLCSRLAALDKHWTWLQKNWPKYSHV